MGRPLSAEYSVKMGFSFWTNLGKELSLWRDAVMNQDIDCAVIVDGKEGAGKSVLGMQIAHFLDKDHHIDLDSQMCFYPEQMKKAIMTLPKFKAIIWDEARRGLNRRRSTQDVNLEMTDLLAECRQHNLFLVIIMPSFYDMDMNVAVWRTRMLIHTSFDLRGDKPGKPLRRGFFRWYSEEGKKSLYTNKYLRQRYEYPHLPSMAFDGRFVKHYVVDEEEYRKRKREAEEAYRKGKVKPDDPTKCPECGLGIKYTNMTEKLRVCNRGHTWPLVNGKKRRGNITANPNKKGEVS